MLFITAHELRRLFINPVTYIAMAGTLFLGALFFYFLIAHYMDTLALKQNIGLTQAVVATFMQLSCILLLLIIPIITMRMFSAERKSTLRLFLSAPVSLPALVIGKYLGTLVLFLVLCGMLLLIPLVVLPAAVLDKGQIAIALLGQLLMLMSMVAIGMFLSVLCNTQAGAAIAGFCVLLLLWILGIVATANPHSILGWFSLLDHYAALRDGLFDSADVSYYLLITVLFTGMTIWWLDAERVRGHQMRLLRVNSAITILLFLLLVALLSWLTNEYRIQRDWTATLRHTLSTASVDLLQQLPEELEVTAYARQDKNLRSVISNFVSRYQKHKENITFRFINPDTVPDEIRNLDITIDGELVLHYADQVTHVKQLSEQYFSNALKRLIRQEEYWIVFAESPDSASVVNDRSYDYSAWAKQLHVEGFHVQPLDLEQSNAIPDNTAVLVLTHSDPTFFTAVKPLLTDYIKSGQNLLWLLDPKKEQQTLYLLDLLGIWIERGVIVDPQADPPAILRIDTDKDNSHPLLRGVRTLLFPTTAFIQHQKIPGSLDWKAETVLFSPQHSWNETGEEKNITPDADESQGMLSFGLSLVRELPGWSNQELKKQHIFIIGDNDFLTNAYVGKGGNLDFGVRIINWLNHEYGLINIPVHVSPDKGVDLNPRTIALRGLLFLLLLPLLSLFTGLYVHLRRKRR